MLFTVTNSGLQNARPTSIGSNGVTIASKATHIFTIANFTTETSPAYSDPEDDSLSYISILTLPTSGELQLGGVAISVNDEISSADLTTSNFTYVADQADSAGYAESFTFDVADTGSNTLSGLSGGIFTMTVQAAVNLPPDAIGDNTINLIYGQSKTFSRADFTTNTTPAYSDPEGDGAYKLKVLTLPADGNLVHNGTNVSVNQEILFTEIDAGYLVYNPDLGITTIQSLTFDFDIADLGSQSYP